MRFQTAALLPVLALLLYAAGCTQSADTADASAVQVAAEDREHAGHEHEGHDHADHSEASHVHGEWWCAEHGVPEEICALCNSKLAADFQRKGDWCADHERPDSQCFICHPELEARFADQYEAKYGEKPSKPQS